MERVVGLVNKLQQICSSLGETALSANAVLWNKLPTIVVVGGQVCYAYIYNAMYIITIYKYIIHIKYIIT